MNESALLQNNAAVEYDPFEGPEIERIVACTEPQIEILTSCLLGGSDANLAFNQSVTLKFTGLLDRAAIEYALQKLVMRHESLRSAFSLKNLQLCIFKDPALEFYYQDISLEEDSKKQAFVKDYIQSDSQHLFDLANGPLFKAGLIKLNEDEHYLVLTAHHIVCDGWSVGIILRELGMLYSGYVQNILIDLPKPALFSQFAAEQVKFSGSDEYHEIEKFWLEQYSDHIPVLDLPTDFTRPQLRTYKSGRLDYQLDNELVVAVKQTGIKAGCSLVTTLLAAFETFLFRLTGQDDIIVGLPAAGQPAAGDYSLVGHCVNLLPLRSNPIPGISFLEYLEMRKTGIFDAYEHQQLTFGSLLKKLRISRDPSRVPLVPAIINVDLERENGVSFYGLEYHLANNPRTTENFELSINITGFKNTVLLECSYNTRLFKAETIYHMMAFFENVLNAITTDPLIRLGDIELIEKSAIVHQWERLNNTKVTYPDNQPLHELIRKVAAKYPAKSALNFRDQEISYRELEEKSNRLAHYFIQGGIVAGDLVGVVLDRSPEMLVTLLAVMKAGAAYIPLDPEYPRDRISFILTDASAKMLITSKKYAGQFNNPTGIVFIENALAESGSFAVTPPGVLVSARDLVYVIYTSGSTGKPKGVLTEHRSLVNLLYSMLELPGFSAKDILLAVTTIAFDIAGLEFFLPLIAGATIVLADTEATKDGGKLLKLIEEKKVSVMQATPSTWKMMLSSRWKKRMDFKILCCGEPMSPDLANKLIPLCKSLWNMYGPTETTIYSTGKRILETDEVITIGKPIHNTMVYIVDSTFNLLPEGSVGEICVCGDGLARGYLNREDLTKEKFIDHPFEASKKMYRTGDLGKFLANDEIQCFGRIDNQVKIRGYRIETGEIENTLEAIEGIKEAVVLYKESKPDDPRLVAYVVTNKERLAEKSSKRSNPGINGVKKAVNNGIPGVSKEQVNEWKKSLGLKLPGYMIPSHFEILPSLPLTLNGKIDRKALPEPSYNDNGVAAVDNKPCSENEKLIAGIWADLLGIGNVSLKDNFFELGGHSLIAIEVMARIEKQAGKKLPPSTLLEHPTVSELAAALDSETDVHKWKSLIPIKPSGNKDPLYIIHGYGLDVMVFNSIARHVDEDQPVYGVKAKGKDGDSDSLDTIEEMASFYISEIIQQNPSGPYALIGFSAGSVIAFEMAGQLKAMNKEIKMLGIMDYDVTELETKTLLRKKIEKYTIQFFPRLFHVLKAFVQHPKNEFKHQLRCLDFRYQDFEAWLGFDKKTEFEKVIDKFGLALKKYVVVPTDVSIDLFSTRIKVYYLKDKKYLGWKPYALKGIKLHEVPGDHYDMVLPPNCGEFAGILQEVLDNS